MQPKYPIFGTLFDELDSFSFDIQLNSYLFQSNQQLPMYLKLK